MMRANPPSGPEPTNGNTTRNHLPLPRSRAVPRRFLRSAAVLALVLATALWAVTLLHPPTALAAAPVSLTLKGQWPGYARGPARDVAVQGQFAYVAADSGGLHVIDIIDPASPKRVGGIDKPEPAGTPDIQRQHLVVSGNYVYVAQDRWDSQALIHRGRLEVIVIADLANPRLVGGVETGGSASGVAVAGNHAYVADHVGLQVLDVSDPVNAARIGGTDTSGDAWDVAVSGNHAYLADYRDGLQVFDITDPGNLRRVGVYDTDGHSFGVAVAGNLIYVADGPWGLPILEQSRALWLEVSGRNPFTFSLSGEPGTAVRLQRSSNLRDWEDRQSATLSDAPLEFSDPGAAGGTSRFYRAIKQ